MPIPSLVPTGLEAVQCLLMAISGLQSMTRVTSAFLRLADIPDNDVCFEG